jgi:ribose transport system substrate-binding protein
MFFQEGELMKNTWVLTAVVIIFIVIIAFAFKTTDFLWGEMSSTAHSQDFRSYRYHFVMIARATEEEYWQQIHASADNVAKWEKVALEYYGPRFLNVKELERFLEMAVLSSVDGILVSVPNEPNFQLLINEAETKKIPVVALSGDIEGGKRSSFVGVNTYDLGFKTGQALSQAVSGEVQVAVLINSNFSARGYNRYLEGLKSAIQPHPNLKLKLVINSKGESISAEEQTQSILTNHPEIQAIVCSDSSDTLGVAKVVVDLNRVTQVTIIGNGLTSEIANYIKRGVIWGVLAEDPHELGAQGISALIRIKQRKSIQELYYMPLFLINTRNVEKYYYNFTTPFKEGNHENRNQTWTPIDPE